MAAAAAGVHTVLIPADNMRDIPELDQEAVAALHLQPCRRLSDVLEAALTDRFDKRPAADNESKLLELHLPSRPDAGRNAEHYGL